MDCVGIFDDYLFPPVATSSVYNSRYVYSIWLRHQSTLGTTVELYDNNRRPFNKTFHELRTDA